MLQTRSASPLGSERVLCESTAQNRQTSITTSEEILFIRNFWAAKIWRARWENLEMFKILIKISQKPSESAIRNIQATEISLKFV